MNKLGQPQKKIIITAVALTAAFIAVWIFLYLPTRNTLNRIRGELDDTESRIRRIEAMAPSGQSIEESIKLLKNRYEQLRSKFPEKEEESVGMISGFARKMNIEISSIKSQAPHPFLGPDGKEIVIEAKKCLVLPVHIEMSCAYSDFVKYTEALKESLPAYATAEKISVSKDKSAPPKLNIALDINLYLLS